MANVDSAIALQQQKQLNEIKDKLLQGMLAVGVPTPVQMQQTATDFRATAEQAQAAADQHVENSKVITQKTTQSVGDLLNFSNEIAATLEADKIARLDQAALTEKVSLVAADLVQESVTRYKEQVTSDSAVEHFKSTSKELAIANMEAQKTTSEINSTESGLLSKIVAAFKFPAIRNRQVQAQQDFDVLQRQRVQATQLFAAEVQSANTIAAISYQQEIASNTRKLESSAILLDNLAKQRANLNDTISSLAQVNQLDSAAVKALREKMEILQSQQINDANAYASVFNAVESESRLRVADKQLKEIARSEESKALLQPMFDAFYALNPNATKVTAKQFFSMSQSEQQALGWADDFKLFARSQAFSAVSPITTAAMKTEARLPLSPVEEVNRQIATTAVDQHNLQKRNDYIAKQVRAGMEKSEVELMLSDPNSAASKSLAAEMINIANPDDLGKADAVGRKALENLGSDSTPLFQSRAIYYNSVQEAASAQGTAELLVKHVPSELLQLIGSPEYAELETRIAKYEDFQRNEDSAVNVAIKLATAVADASNPAAVPQVDFRLADKQLKVLSTILAGNYKAQRIATQRVDYPLLSGTKITSPRVGNGAAGQELVNYEDAGSVYTRLRLRLLQKQSRSTGPNLNPTIFYGSGAVRN